MLGRIARIDATTRAIVAGDLSARVPGRGTDDELDRLTSGINDMLDRLQTLMVDLKRVTTDVAHDLRTPLARLRQKLESAREEATGVADYAAVTDEAVAEVDRLLGIFTALMRIAEIEARARRSAFAAVDLSTLAADMAEVYEPVAEETGHHLALRIEPHVGIVGDRALVQQILANLVENALRHTPAGTTVTVEVTTRGGRPVLGVADDGPGVPADMREEVQKPFRRLETARSTSGSGLGLALVKAVATLHEADLLLGDGAPGLRAEIVFPEPASRPGAADQPAGSRPAP
ncbi:sensor histidine kinase [Methylobrevis pamukkalensis]|uniref:histidine kinase n=1 Tax=Methylobrevis pamukkalensis TaxID=1439726 RepID=A0A1E3H2H9_9HYPH|nr:HAMP domain-containing sensor histidine kinase [Methylobrevis pamukkalensis]ODN70537.1 putative sensor histidine kinase TcrY [Methylobrevis pamukkalensis]